jgi:hypothetical protein
VRQVDNEKLEGAPQTPERQGSSNEVLVIDLTAVYPPPIPEEAGSPKRKTSFLQKLALSRRLSSR